MKPNPHSVPSSVRKKFLDNFARSQTENGLGQVNDGSFWDIIRGAFRIFDLRATSTSDVSEYPMATVNMPYEDVKIELRDIDSGSGAALWVTGSGDWWAVSLDQEIVDCNCDQGTDCDRWNARNCAARNQANCNRWTCTSYSGNNVAGCTSYNAIERTCNANQVYGPFPYCRRWDDFGRCISVGYEYNEACTQWSTSGGNCRSYAWNSNNCTGNSCNRWNSTNCIRYNAETCNRWFEFTFNCETCYPQYVRVLQSIGNNVSTMFSYLVSRTFRTVSSTYGSLTLFEQDDINEPTAKSMQITTESNIIDVNVFSDDDLFTKINVGESITYTPTNAEVYPTYGIVITPSEYNQQNFIGEIDIDKNF